MGILRQEGLVQLIYAEEFPTKMEALEAERKMPFVSLYSPQRAPSGRTAILSFIFLVIFNLSDIFNETGRITTSKNYFEQ